MADFATKTGVSGTVIPNTVDTTPALTDRVPITGGKETSISNIVTAVLADATTAASIGAGVTVQATGTGAEVRSVQDWKLDFISVMDFIPVAEHAAIRAGTSTYDCQPSFAEAWAARGSRRVFIPDGSYRLASSWVLDRISGTPGEVVGESTFGTRLLPDNTITAIRFTSAEVYSSVSLRSFTIRHDLTHTSGGGIHCANGVLLFDCTWEDLQIDSHGIPIYIGSHFSHLMQRITCRSLGDCFVIYGGNTVQLINCYGSYWAEDGGTAIAGAAAFRIANTASMLSCNGVDGLEYWLVAGGKTGDAYFTATSYPDITLIGCNLEGWTKAGIKTIIEGKLNVKKCSFQYTHVSNAFDAWIISDSGGLSTIVEDCVFQSAGGAQTNGGTSSIMAATGTPNLILINQGTVYQYYNTSNSSLYPTTTIVPTSIRTDTSIVNIKQNFGNSGNAIPSPADADVAYGVEVYSAPRGVGSGMMYYDGSLWHSMVRDKLTKDYQLSANTTIDSRYLDGRRITNGGASGTITATLPASAVGDYAFFCRNIAQTFRIDPNGSEIIGTGGAGKYLELGSLGAAVKLRCVYAGIWMIDGQQGTITYEP